MIAGTPALPSQGQKDQHYPLTRIRPRLSICSALRTGFFFLQYWGFSLLPNSGMVLSCTHLQINHYSLRANGLGLTVALVWQYSLILHPEMHDFWDRLMEPLVDSTESRENIMSIILPACQLKQSKQLWLPAHAHCLQYMMAYLLVTLVRELFSTFILSAGDYPLLAWAHGILQKEPAQTNNIFLLVPIVLRLILDLLVCNWQRIPIPCRD